MFGGDDSGGHYTNRLPKHPRLSRMQGIEQVNGDLHRGGKQPRPLEDGNWICEDTNCANVNYPRRTECNKCGKRRGPLGDQVVKAYIESIKIARGEMAPSPQLVSVGPERLGMARGMMPPRNGSDVSPQQQGISISPGSSNLVGELEPWMGGGYEQPIPSFASQYVTGDGGLSGRRSTLSAATEGKRLAEQLVASFAASSDPVGDAGECLASAALWLQTMKARMQTGDSFGLSTSSLSSPMPGTSSPMVLGGPLLGMNGGVPMLTQSPLSTASIGSNAGLGNLAINAGTSISNGSMMGNHLARVNPPSVGISPGARALLPRTLRYEDYKERPSDYLREFGDPAAVSATAMGGGHRPESGVFGNWECEECKNVNFPRRTNCFQCHKRRGSKGEEIVRKYVRSLIEEANRA